MKFTQSKFYNVETEKRQLLSKVIITQLRAEFSNEIPWL